MFSSIDRLLRGGYTSGEELRSGSIDLPARKIALLCVLLGGLYGACMGLFAALDHPEAGGAMQVLASAVKVPALFLFTLAVTFPSLYVVSALTRSPLTAGQTLKLMLASIAVNMALLASLGPVTAFFTLSTDSYPFMVLLNVFVFGVSGLVGLGFLMRALHNLHRAPASVTDGDDSSSSSPPDSPSGATHRGGLVFKIWVAIYGLVGAQMAWIMRPFVGDPALEFAWFRAREASFFTGWLDAVTEFVTNF